MISVLPRRSAAAVVEEVIVVEAPAVGGLDLDLEVVRISLDLVPGRPVAVQAAEELELGEVGQEDVRQVDHHGVAVGVVDADDRQGQQHRVEVILLDRPLHRRAGRRLVVDVAPDQMDLVAGPLEDEDPLVAEVQRLPGHPHAARDVDRRQQGLVELVRLDLGVEMLVLPVEREQAVDLLGALGHLVEVAELLLTLGRPGRGRPWPCPRPRQGPSPPASSPGPEARLAPGRCSGSRPIRVR